MKIGIISDIHDHVHHLTPALSYLQPHTDCLFCLGDLCSPFVLGMLGRLYDKPVHLVMGNNDADLFRMMTVASKKENAHLYMHGESAHLVLDDNQFKPFSVRKDQPRDAFTVGLTHFPDIAISMHKSGIYQLVCYGHDHTQNHPYAAPPLLVNPGSIMGYQPGKDQYLPPEFCILDTETLDLQPYQLLPDSTQPRRFKVLKA
ncbi:MAG: metallophosphoesterase family protein [Bacteroidota bacterium]